MYNRLPLEIKSIAYLPAFRKALNSYLLGKAFYLQQFLLPSKLASSPISSWAFS